MDFSPHPIFRAVRLIAHRRMVVAHVVDNCHDFLTALHHDGAKVVRVSGRMRRFPFVTCPGAIAQLQQLVDTPLDASPRVDQTSQCTHLLDLARLALAHSNRGGRRFYEVRIHLLKPKTANARLSLDGKTLFEWVVESGVVVSPGPFIGHVTTGRSLWSPEVQANPDLREAGLIVRRALVVFEGRPAASRVRGAFDLPHQQGVCYSFQPERMATAHRPRIWRELDCDATTFTLS